MALGLLDAMRDYGVRIPDDISIVCYDDTPLVAEGHVRLTTVGVEPARMAEAAVNLLFKKVGKAGAEPKKILYKPHLTVRDSVKKIN